MIGHTLGPYLVVEKIGEGGMGVVYRARDTRLDRDVAIKVLRTDVVADPDRRRRFTQEARAVSRLNHPGIVTLFEMTEATDASQTIDFLVMEYVPGESLHRRIRSARLAIDAVLDLGRQGALALAAAHDAGIVHRDLKPGNMMVTPDGRLKILDFGLARLVQPVDPNAPTSAGVAPTRTGLILGTLGYLSPEQASGGRVDARSDLFAFGVVLYEMLTGSSPFARDSDGRSLAAVLHDTPPAVSAARDDVPPGLTALVGSCLEKDPARRPASAAAIAASMREIADSLREASKPRSGRFWLGATVAAGAAAVAAGTVWVRGADARWARDEAIPALQQLIREDQAFKAFLLAREIDARVPGHPEMGLLWPEFTFAGRIESEPADALVELQDYAEPDGVWRAIGRTPITDLRIPERPLRVRVTKPGFDTLEAAPLPAVEGDGLVYRIALSPTGAAPPGMVRVLGGTESFRGAPPVEVEDFWIDRLEVTNGDFQRFVDAGGYRRPEYWRHPVIDNGRPLALGDALRRFEDSTGRPGPATWAFGRFPEGTRDLPVGGVSWYEAAAYAEWAGKSLPTYYHWYRAAMPDAFADIVRASRFGGDAPAAVGSLTGLGPWGTLDMAGNVKEWTWSATGSMRYALGAAWNDPGYLFAEPEAFPPLRRDADTGFRCIKVDRPASGAALAPVVRQERDLSRERPVSDEVFRALVSVYTYDRTLPLDARREGAEEVQADWREERVSIAAAYGGERLPILLYLPKGAKPPHSIVVYFPDSTAEQTATPAPALQRRWFDFLVRAGHAVAVPVFKNTYERYAPRTGPWTPTWRRDLVIAWSKDLGRTLDYLATRPDIDSNRVALHGFSLGAIYGPILAALEPRLKAVVLLGGGIGATPMPPEADPFQFVSRVRAATLMIAGREDFVRPVEKAQRPLFDLLGVPPDRKRLAILEGGHMPPSLPAVVREMLDWLERFLGPV